MTWVASASGSATQMRAALFRYFARCRSTQLYEALSFPPTNHFQNGALLVSSVVCQYLTQVKRTADSLWHSGKFFSVKRAHMAVSLAVARPMNSGVGERSEHARTW